MIQATRNGPNIPEENNEQYVSIHDDGRNKLNISDLRASGDQAVAARLRIADVLKTPNRFGFQPN
jgi:hypothetical protein